MLLRSCLSSWCIVFVVIFRLFCFSDKANRDYILKGNGCIDTLLSLFEVRPIHRPTQPTFRLNSFLILCTILRQSQTLIYFFRTATMDKCVRTSFKHSSKSSENRVSTKETCSVIFVQFLFDSNVLVAWNFADTSKRAAILVSHGTTHALFVILAEEGKAHDAHDDLLIYIHQLLTKLAPKGSKTQAASPLVTTHLFQEWFSLIRPEVRCQGSIDQCTSGDVGTAQTVLLLSAHTPIDRACR